MVYLDKTEMFKETVKKKVLGTDPTWTQQPPSPTPSPQPVSVFNHQVKTIFETIRRLYKFLEQTREDYIDAAPHLSSQASEMSDQERDAIDSEVKLLISECQKKIKDLTEFLKSKHLKVLNVHYRDHLQGIIKALEKKMEEVTYTYSQQKSLRFQRALEAANAMNPSQYFSTSSSLFAPEKRTPHPTQEVYMKLNREREKESKQLPAIVEDFKIDDLQRQVLEEENVKLHNQLDTMMDKAMVIEKQIIEISELLEYFQEKVNEQGVQIDEIKNLTIDAVGNVEEGTAILRDVAKSSEGLDFTLIVVCFLFIMGCAVLFLHWYE